MSRQFGAILKHGVVDKQRYHREVDQFKTCIAINYQTRGIAHAVYLTNKHMLDHKQYNMKQQQGNVP